MMRRTRWLVVVALAMIGGTASAESAGRYACVATASDAELPPCTL